MKKIKNVFTSNFFVKTTLVQIVIFITIQSSIHASDSTSLKVWIDFIEESDTIFIKGIVANLTDKKIDLKYQLNVQTMTPRGEANQTKTNNYKAESYSPNIIAEAKIDFKKREYFLVTFSVFDQKNILVGTDTLKSIQIDPKATKVLPPQKPMVQNQSPPPQKNWDALEIDGLILDETRSKIGRDFYEMFYNRWTAPRGAKDYLITIKEIPGRGIGARISIQVNDNIVLYRFLQPRSDLIEQEANTSISYLKNYLQRNENLKQDLEIGDAMGSGIF